MSKKYKAKFTYEAFEYDPHGYMPAWFKNMESEGKAFIYAETPKEPAYVAFGDKRSQHKAFIGDYIVRDEFGRVDVYSARNFAQRGELLRCDKTKEMF